MDGITIAIAEDNELALKSILKKLSFFNDLSIMFAAGNGTDLLDKFMSQQPGIVLMDIEMPVMDGIAATRQLKEQHPQVKVLMLTTFDDDDKIFNAILAGASGYLLKDESAEAIYKAINDIYNGGAAMSSGIALKTLNHIKSTAPVLPPDSQSVLSQREMEILTELKNGLGYKQIASRLFISEGTVRKHIEHIYRKLQVNNKVSAVNVAVNNKWLT
ncbi:MAG TPA: response regulator transcription factor [Niabella sp.]|nr:response regulator transcription factor [Niabella sp.]